MTVGSQSNIVTYTGDGVATVFPFTFPVYDAEHVNVYRYTITSGAYATIASNAFTVAGVGNENGGSVTILGTAVPATDKIIITRQVPLLQDLDLLNQGGFYPENLETQLDLMEMQIQQVREEARRAIRLPLGETLEAIAAAPERISKLIGFGTIGELRLASPGDLAKGDPGGNSEALGLFQDAHTMSIPLGTDVVKTSGFTVLGKGAAHYMYDVAVDAAYVTANPLTSFISSNGRGFRYVFDGTVDIDAFGADPTGVADSTTNCQAALNYLNANGGGVFQAQRGTYKTTAYIQVYPKTIVRGKGRQATLFLSAHAGGGGANAGQNLRNGSCFVSVSPINSSTGVFIKFEDLTVQNTNATPLGAGYYDTGGTFISAINFRVIGFKYGVVLDQSELVSFDNCGFEAQKTGGAGVWIVNGPALTPGVSGGFTNVIAFEKCQFNQISANTCVIDDGGDTHTYNDCNFNGGLHAVRSAGVAGAMYYNCRAESIVGHVFLLDNLTSTGAGSGGNFMAITGGFYIAPIGFSTVHGTGAGPGSLSLGGAVQFYGSFGSNPITGCTLFSQIWIGMIVNLTAGLDLCDGEATNHYDTTQLKVADDQVLTFQDIGGPLFDGLIRRRSDTPHRILDLVSKGGVATGGWFGAVYFSLGFEENALVDAFKVYMTSATDAEADLAGPLKINGTRVLTDRQVKPGTPTLDDVVAVLVAHGLWA